jgi:hypothetical protein
MNLLFIYPILFGLTFNPETSRISGDCAPAVHSVLTIIELDKNIQLNSSEVSEIGCADDHGEITVSVYRKNRSSVLFDVETNSFRVRSVVFDRKKTITYRK